MAITNPYEVLGVDANADDAAIRAAFRRAAKDCHPDLNGGSRAGERRLRRLMAARDMLTDGRQRPFHMRKPKPYYEGLRVYRGRKRAIFAGVLAGAGAFLFLVVFAQDRNPASRSFEASANTTVYLKNADVFDTDAAEIKAIRDWREMESSKPSSRGTDLAESKLPQNDSSAARRHISRPRPTRLQSAVTSAAFQVSRTWRKLTSRIRAL